jgi:hypothetical protein
LLAGDKNPTPCTPGRSLSEYVAFLKQNDTSMQQAYALTSATFFSRRRERQRTVDLIL